jgi:hypothetical protein
MSTDQIYIDLIKTQDPSLMPALLQWQQDRNDKFEPLMLKRFQQLLVATIEAIEELEEAEQCQNT